MRTIRAALFYVAVLFWLGLFIWLIWPIEPPITELPGAYVTPTTAKVGGSISILRNFRASRNEPVTVIRTLVRVDCGHDCEVADLPTGKIIFPAGDQPGRVRDHKLPYAVEPGKWKAVFFLEWRDRIGRVHSEPLQELSFTVVP